MKSINEFLDHCGPLKALRFDRGRWTCLQHDGSKGDRRTIEEALFQFCGAMTRRDKSELWRDLKESFAGCYGLILFPLKAKDRHGAYSIVNRPEPPVVSAKAIGDQWRIDCPYCGDVHYHGVGPGHRIEHCASRNLISLPGYVLEIES